MQSKILIVWAEKYNVQSKTTIVWALGLIYFVGEIEKAYSDQGTPDVTYIWKFHSCKALNLFLFFMNSIYERASSCMRAVYRVVHLVDKWETREKQISSVCKLSGTVSKSSSESDVVLDFNTMAVLLI